jgi:hypothetical protein
MMMMMDDPTPVINWMQPDGSCRQEWPDGQVMIFSAEEWQRRLAALARDGFAGAGGWGETPDMKVVELSGDSGVGGAYPTTPRSPDGQRSEQAKPERSGFR